MTALVPRFYWVNRHQPFTVGKQTIAHNGRVAIMRTATSGNIGKPMLVRYRLATAAQILAWKSLAEGFTSFNTTSIHATFTTGKTVIFSSSSPITYENELGLQDIDIGDDFSSKEGFDLWRGTLSLIIVGE